MFRRSLVTAAAVAVGAAALAAPGAARADVIGITSEGGTSTSSLGAFTGIVEFNENGFAGGADLSFTLTNTLPVGSDGYLTGFVFNVADDSLTVTFVDNDGAGAGFEDVTGGGLSANPFGTFEEGAALGGAFLGGGSPTDGIAAGDTRQFLFNVTGDLTNVSVMTFLSELSEPTGGNDGEVFVARFKGLINEGSDKVVPGTVQVVPVPAAVWGGASLLGGLGAFRAARRRRAEAAE